MSTIMFEQRKWNLRLQIERESRGNVAAFCKSYDLDPGYIWQLLNDRRSFGEKSARKIEGKIAQPVGFLDREFDATEYNIRTMQREHPDTWRSRIPEHLHELAETLLAQPTTAAAPARDRSVPEREAGHIIPLQNAKEIRVRSFAQIINNEQGTDTMIVFGELPESAYGYRLETDHMEGQPVFIQRGAVLVIDPDLAPVEGDIILANVADRPTIGLFEYVGGKSMAVATRDKIPAVEVKPDQVLGVVLEWKVQHRNPSRGTLS